MSYPSVETPAKNANPSKALIDWMKSIFGVAFSVSRGYSSAHDGIDLPAKEGTPIKAIASGKVVYARDARKQADKGAGNWAQYGGNVVNIDIGSGYVTQYAHLKNFIVTEGQYVQAGQIIGYVGHTGGQPDSPNASFVGSHLHFGLWDQNATNGPYGKSFGKMINPQQFFQNLGDTSGGDIQANAAAAKIAQLLGKKVTDPLTEEDIKKIITTPKDQGGYGIPENMILFDDLFQDLKSRFLGQPISSFGAAAAADTGKNDPLGIGAALASATTQLTDTFTWIGFILVGLVLIAGGIYLLGGNKIIAAASEGA